MFLYVPVDCRSYGKHCSSLSVLYVTKACTADEDATSADCQLNSLQLSCRSVEHSLLNRLRCVAVILRHFRAALHHFLDYLFREMDRYQQNPKMGIIERKHIDITTVKYSHNKKRRNGTIKSNVKASC